MAELPLVVVHCQHLGNAETGVVLPGDVDVARTQHVGLSGVPVPTLAVADAASAPRLKDAAFDIARRLRTPVILLTSIGIAMPDAVADLHGVCQSSLMEAEAPAEPQLAGGPAPPSRRSPIVQVDSVVINLSSDGKTDARLADGSLPLDTAPRPGHVQFAGTVNGRRVFLNLKPTEIEARLSRLRDKILNAAPSLEFVQADIDPDAETLLLSYGLADQAAREAVKIVRAAGARVSHLTIFSLWPMSQDALRRALTPFVRRVLVPELNLGLYAAELQRVFHNIKIESLACYDGRLIEPAVIAKRITDWPCG